MARKQLADIPLTITWTTLIGALHGVLRFLGEPIAPDELMGVTGFAFRLALTERDGVLAATSAAASVDLPRALPLLENGGRALTLLQASPGTAEFISRRDEALRAIHRSVDRGRPAIAFDLHLPEFGIVRGYDADARTLTVSSLLSGQFGAMLPESRWPVPERVGRVTVLLPGGRRPRPGARVHAAALRFAAGYAEHGDPGDPTGATHGLAAYARWRRAFEAAEPIDAAGNARAIQTVQAARRDAARFLRGIATLYPGAAPSLTAAASAYEGVALAFSRMATLFPYPAGGDVTGAAGRYVALSALGAAEGQERVALDRIREALPQMPAATADSATEPARPLLGRLFRGRRERR
jgi:hypothetical protein